jgi:hypothetical protein
MRTVHYRDADVLGRQLFCREAGPAGAPVDAGARPVSQPIEGEAET